MFSLRIVNVDHYMSPPKPGLDLTYSQFRGSTIKSVPILRIFGATPSGDKTCLHIHGVFPYILVPYSGDQDAGSVMYQLAASLDKAINVSLGSSFSNKQYVFKITQVSGRPFYGYHGQDHQFLKIFFYTPLIIKRACDLLQNGAVCGTRFQIHEGHVPFILQFFIDYNLYGMSFIDVKKVIFRKGANQPGPVGSLSKDSVCKLEADAVAIDILNRIKVEGEMAVNPGLAAIWEEEKKRLNKDKLDDSSYRPTPPLIMSEVLLREKLLENLKLQGKCKATLKEKIPYPAETQYSNGNEGVIDASMLDSHSISSLLPSQVAKHENTQIDEEIIHNLTQNMQISSGEISLLAALDDLATYNEVPQNVEDYSVLGSQAVVDSVSDDDDMIDYSLALPHHSDDSDSSFEDNIPQLDGVEDFVKKEKKTQKQSLLTDKENTCKEHDKASESGTTDNLKSNQTSLIESENQEINNDIFQDIQPFCSPLHDINNLEEADRFSLSLSDMSLFEDTEADLNLVLKGDPSFSCKDSTLSHEVFFGQKMESHNLNPNLNESRCSSAQTTPFKEYPLKTELEKSSALSDSESIFGISHLDQLFDDELNEGMETQSENNSELVKKAEKDTNELLSVELKSEETTDCLKTIEEEDLTDVSPHTKTTEQTSTRSEFKPEPLISDVLGKENLQPQTKPSKVKISVIKDDIVEMSTSTENVTNTPAKSTGSSPNTSQHSVATTVRGSRIINKNRKMTSGKYDGWDMTNEEVKTYFYQVNKLSRELLLKQAASKSTKPIIWHPIRNSPILAGRRKIKHRRKISRSVSKNVFKQNGGCKLSKEDRLKLTSCFVLLQKLSVSELNSILKPGKGSYTFRQQLGKTACSKKALSSDALRSYEMENEKKKKSKPLTIEQAIPKHSEVNQCQKSNEIHSFDLSTNTSKKLCRSEMCNPNVVKQCQVVLNKKEDNSENKSLAQPKKLKNSNSTKQSPKTESQAHVACEIKLFQPLLSDDHEATIVSSKKENIISGCRLNKGAMKSNEKKITLNNTADVSRDDFRFCKESDKKRERKNQTRDDISTEANSLLSTKTDVVTLPPTKPFQIVLNKHVSKSKPDQKENLNGGVCNTKLSNCPIRSSLKSENKFENCPVESIGKYKTQHVKPLRKRNASLSRDLNQNLKEKAVELITERKKSLTVVSLDGTCDHSSSSDENVPEPSADVKCTPSKRRKSSPNVTNTPKSKYVPLCVEIKKSPTVKLESIALKNESQSNFKEAFSSTTSDKMIEEKPLQPFVKIEKLSKLGNTLDGKQNHNCSTVKMLKEKPLQPFVKIKRLPLGIEPVHAGGLPAGSFLKMKTKAYPLVKKLKISVKRWSTDEQGNSGCGSLRASKMGSRRLSLPVTAK